MQIESHYNNPSLKSKKGYLHSQKKEIKKLKSRIKELREKNDILLKNSNALEIKLAKTTTLDPLNQNVEKTSKLWSLLFDTQYNFLHGSYKEYKISKINYAKEASQNLDLLSFIKAPIQGQIKLFSKIGLNAFKNLFLDKFRIKTPEEKILENYSKNQKKQQIKENILN